MRRFIQNFELFWHFKFRVRDWLQWFLMRFSVLEDLNTINNHQIQNLKFSIFEIGFIRKPHCSLTEFWPNFETSKNKKVNFDPLNFFNFFIFFISCLNIIIKGYKSQSPAKFAQIYYLCRVPPLGGMSKNDEKSMIFDDFGKIHDFPGPDIPAELVKTAGDWVLMTSYLLLSPKKIRGKSEMFLMDQNRFIFLKNRNFEPNQSDLRLR